MCTFDKKALREVNLVEQNKRAIKHLGCWHELLPGHHWEISEAVARGNASWPAWHYFCLLMALPMACACAALDANADFFAMMMMMMQLLLF